MPAISKTDFPISSLVELPVPPPNPLRFLEPGATPAQLIRATAANHRKWFARGAITQTYALQSDSITWVCTPDDITIPFPRLSSAWTGDILNHVIADCRKRAPKRVSCWALTPTRPRDLGAMLCAQGFEWGWQPHWMALDLHTMRADFPLPDSLRITIDNSDNEADWDVDDLPYYSRKKTEKNKAEGNKTTAPGKPVRESARREWHFGAWLNSKIVGHSILYLTMGRQGVAGIYNVGVVPNARHQGIGSAITLAACQVAQAMGCHYATLNSAADALYERMGFVSQGHGQTWWMHENVLNAPPPTPEQVAFAEAVGRGDVKTLAALDKRGLPADLDAPLLCGQPPMELAVCLKQPRSVEWLTAQGATLNILNTWDLGWKERAARMLAETPALVNRRTGSRHTTPLHEAVFRNDVELARLLLSANPDLTIQDAEYHSTPLGWARHFGQTEIIALIERHQLPARIASR
jgi:ribosomal protein S18 acetylase RimI-like enzyme